MVIASLYVVPFWLKNNESFLSAFERSQMWLLLGLVVAIILIIIIVSVAKSTGGDSGD